MSRFVCFVLLLTIYYRFPSITSYPDFRGFVVTVWPNCNLLNRRLSPNLIKPKLYLLNILQLVYIYIYIVNVLFTLILFTVAWTHLKMRQTKKVQKVGIFWYPLNIIFRMRKGFLASSCPILPINRAEMGVMKTIWKVRYSLVRAFVRNVYDVKFHLFFVWFLHYIGSRKSLCRPYCVPYRIYEPRVDGGMQASFDISMRSLCVVNPRFIFSIWNTTGDIIL